MGMVGVLMAFEDDGFLTIDLDEEDYEEAEGFVTSVDVDKAWHALSAITTPSAEPLRSLENTDPLDPLLGGDEFGDDNGYGPARHLTPDQVRAIHGHLSTLRDDEARARFDPDAFAAADIYPSIWDEDADELWADYLLPNLTAVRAFYAAAAAAGHHVVLELQ